MGLIHQVVLLANRFSWSEDAILGMSSRRRMEYCEIVSKLYQQESGEEVHD